MRMRYIGKVQAYSITFTLSQKLQQIDCFHAKHIGILVIISSKYFGKGNNTLRGERGKRENAERVNPITNGWFKKLHGISDHGVHIVPTIF